jgi:hypothetical protein
MGIVLSNLGYCPLLRLNSLLSDKDLRLPILAKADLD